VRPPSVERYTPLPHGELCRFCGSPVPTQTTLGLEGAMVTSPIDEVSWSSNTGSNVIPLFTVFQIPAVAVPT
jgi:hypothetical protein